MQKTPCHSLRLVRHVVQPLVSQGVFVETHSLVDTTHDYRVDPEETHFACPECRHPLHLFGMHLEDFGESMVDMPMDEETLAFIDEYTE